MIIRKTTLQKSTTSGADSKARDRAPLSRPKASLLGRTVMEVLSGRGRDAEEEAGELDALPLPDLLSPSAGSGPDPGELRSHVDMAFLGRASAGELDSCLEQMECAASSWDASNFAEDLFLDELVKRTLTLRSETQELARHPRFLQRVLANPPTSPEPIRFRQAILRELDADAAIRDALFALLAKIVHLLSLLRASRDDARLHPVRFRLAVLRCFRQAVELMDTGFAESRSGLVRLHSAGQRIRRSQAFNRMTALLDHQEGMATLQLQVLIGADGGIRHLEIGGLKECKGNPYYRRPLRRWWDRLRLLLRRYKVDGDELVDRLVMEVYQQIAPALTRVIQLLCHLEVYATMRSFAAESAKRGLEVCLAELEPGVPLGLEQLFNPLLLQITERPVPSDLRLDRSSTVALVTGPNSGGKTRLLQAVGLAQLLGQSGFYTPARRARLPLIEGLFASIIEMDRADQAEGRLGTELVRLRALFESAPPGSLVLLDELCSGTNPSEAVQIVDTVLRLLGQLEPVAFVTTHFLDFAEELERQHSGNGLCFLQAEVDARRGATYRFVPGVADTSLAVGTARRLGLTFEELETELRSRLGRSGDSH